MDDESPELSPEDDNGNLGLIIVLAFAFGPPLVGMLVSAFTRTPSP